MAEELALEKALRNRRAIDRQQRFLFAGAVLMDRPGDQLLARTALACDEHVDVLWCDEADTLVDLLHRRRLADHTVAWGHRRRHVGIRYGDVRPRDLDRPLEPRFDVVRLQRRHEAVECAVPHGLDHLVALPRIDDDKPV